VEQDSIERKVSLEQDSSDFKQKYEKYEKREKKGLDCYSHA